MPKKKREWESESIFSIKLKNGAYGLGQILEGGSRLITAAFFDSYFTQNPQLPIKISRDNVIAVLKITINHLADGTWNVIDRGHPVIEKNKWQQITGSSSYTSNVAQSFMNAYFGLQPWDDYYDPHFFDGLLFGTVKRPPSAKLVKSM